MKSLADLKVKLFADGADKAGMLEMHAKPWIRGFTTNPTLMRKAGLSDYEGFARDIASVIADRPPNFWDVGIDRRIGIGGQQLVAGCPPPVIFRLERSGKAGEPRRPGFPKG